MRVHAIITDIDSTLVDNRRRKAMSVAKVLGSELDDEVIESALKETSLEGIARALGLSPTSELIDRIVDVYLDDMSLYNLDEPLDGAVETMNDLANQGRMVIYVSGRPSTEYVEPFLRRMGFPKGPIYARRIRGGSEAVRLKFELMSRALAENSLRNTEVLAVGDMPHDGLASRMLGIFSIGTLQLSSYSVERLSQYFDEVITHIRQLKDVVMRLERSTHAGFDG